MQMKKFINDPNTLTDELLEGLALAHADTVDVQGHLVISRALESADRVTIVTFGGSGHEPAQCGFVGEGMVDIQVVGDIFAAPNPQLVFEAVKMADKGHGVLLLVLNHAGDMLCGNMVMKMAGKAGLNVRKVVTQEDISNAPRSNSDDRRGLAGAIPLYHIAAAAAREGDEQNGSFMCGQIAGLVNKEQPAAEIIREMFAQAEELLKGAAQWVR